MSKVQKLTAVEIRAALEEALRIHGFESVGSIVEHLIEKAAEKDSSMLEGQPGDSPTARRAIELVTFKSILDKLYAAYHEELHVHKTGEQPVYQTVDND